MLRLIINPLAETDLAEAQSWYDHKSPGLGAAFLDSVRNTFHLIRQTPLLYAEAFDAVRLALVQRFPYLVLYRIDDDQITVIAVYHTRRDPRGWRDRA